MGEFKKYLIASDLHGSLYGLENVLFLFEKHKADKLVLLGDIFGSNAAEMVDLLNSFSSKLTIVKGNNDWYYEPENAKFEIMKDAYLNINGVLAYACHGHRLNDMDLAGYGAKIVMMGHVHRPFIRLEQGVVWMCPGSMAVPRGENPKTFALIDDKKIQILTPNGEVVNELEYK